MSESQTLLDPGAFVRLREWGGDELLGKMLALYLKNAPDRMGEIRSGVQEGDGGRIEQGAHSLKSSSANLGAERLRWLCQRMEDAGEDGRLAEARGLLPELEEAYRQTVEALEMKRTPPTQESP
jgi:HPt (histidine-containing phosphotransfer) domain-containing protein